MGFAGTLTAVAMLGNGFLIERFGHEVSLNVLLGLTTLVLVLSFLLPSEIGGSLEERVEQVNIEV